jgi:hypothetical protein
MENKIEKRFQFKITKDRNGKDRCTLYVDGKNFGSATRGEDLKAVVLKEYIKRTFYQELRKRFPFVLATNEETTFTVLVGVLICFGYSLGYVKNNLASEWYALNKIDALGRIIHKGKTTEVFE